MIPPVLLWLLTGLSAMAGWLLVAASLVMATSPMNYYTSRRERYAIYACRILWIVVIATFVGALIQSELN